MSVRMWTHDMCKKLIEILNLRIRNKHCLYSEYLYLICPISMLGVFEGCMGVRVEE